MLRGTVHNGKDARSCSAAHTCSPRGGAYRRCSVKQCLKVRVCRLDSGLYLLRWFQRSRKARERRCGKEYAFLQKSQHRPTTLRNKMKLSPAAAGSKAVRCWYCKKTARAACCAGALESRSSCAKARAISRSWRSSGPADVYMPEGGEGVGEEGGEGFFLCFFGALVLGFWARGFLGFNRLCVAFRHLLRLRAGYAACGVFKIGMGMQRRCLCLRV